MQTAIDSAAISNLYQEVKFWAALVGGLWTAFKGFNWVKDIREKDLRGIQSDVNSLNSELNRQTNTIASGFSSLQAATTRELQELRSDFRTFYTAPDPIMLPARARSTGNRKKDSVAARKRAKFPKKGAPSKA